MKNLIQILILSVLVVVATQKVVAQNDVKVLMEEISGEYTGDSKKGLAHGQGKAVGKDTYEGKFKKGLPHGKGTYTWANGDTYEGMWKKGKMHGSGKLTVQAGDKEIVKSGIWKNDEFVRKVEPRPYKINQQRNITRYTVRKLQDTGNQIVIDFMQAGGKNHTLENLMISGDSGSRFQSGSMTGYENVEFPFNLKVDYTSSNSLQTQKYDCTFDITFEEPGYYKIVLTNQ